MSRFVKLTVLVALAVLIVSNTSQAGILRRGRRCAPVWTPQNCQACGPMLAKWNDCDNKTCPIWEYLYHPDLGYSSYYSLKCASGSGTASNWDGPPGHTPAVNPCQQGCQYCESVGYRNGDKKKEGIKKKKPEKTDKPVFKDYNGATATPMNGHDGDLVKISTFTKTIVAQIWEVKLTWPDNTTKTYYIGNEVELDDAPNQATYVRQVDTYQCEISYKGSDTLLHSYYIILHNPNP